MLNHSIPSFALYGETDDSPMSLGVHVEDIEERSRGNDWKIAPHRHGNLFQLIYVVAGRATVRVDDKTHFLEKTALVTIPTGTAHGFSFQPGTQGVVLSIARDALDSISTANHLEPLRPVLDQARVIPLEEHPELHQQFDSYLGHLRFEFENAHRDKAASLPLLVALLMLNLKRHIDPISGDTVTQAGASPKGEEFRHLLERHYRQHWSVAAYAQALNVSTSTLNRICRTHYGTGAKSIITARVITEAKRRLVYTRQPLDQIAFHLGFRDPAYFSRIFRKSEGISPSIYRSQKQL